MQDRLTEAHERHQEVVKNLQASEEAKRKMKYELQQLQMQVQYSVYYVCICTHTLYMYTDVIQTLVYYKLAHRIYPGLPSMKVYYIIT